MNIGWGTTSAPSLRIASAPIFGQVVSPIAGLTTTHPRLG
jgi:hypothetical protein